MPVLSPVLSVTPSSLSFAADGIPGDYPTQPLTISNAGTGSFTFQITSDPTAPLTPFITISPSTGTVSAGTPQIVQLGIGSAVVGPYALPPNKIDNTGRTVARIQTTTLTITATGATNSPQTATVSLTPILRISTAGSQSLLAEGRLGGGVSFEF
jgi:hypothetical protein